MKKINKLIPLLSTALIASPIMTLTSCNKENSNKCCITFFTNIGGQVSQNLVQVEKNTKWKDVNKPQIIEDYGYIFYAWKLDGNIIDPETVISNDCTINVEFIQCTDPEMFEAYVNESADNTATITGIKAEYLNEDDETIIIPSQIDIDGLLYKVNCIGVEAFKDNTTIKNVIIPQSVNTLDKNVFVGCTNLTCVEFLLNTSNWTRSKEGNDGFVKSFDISDGAVNAETLKVDSDVYWTFGPSFALDGWDVICGLANTGGLDALKKHYHLAEYGLNSFVGLERKVTINGVEHWVRVIGENHDELSNSSGETATLTFESCGVIISKQEDKGGALGKWDDNSHNYADSQIRANLEGSTYDTTKTVSWKQEDLNVNGDIYTQLQGNTGLSLKQVKKEVTLKKDNKWGKEFIDSYVFVLSNREMDINGYSGDMVEGKPYAYWHAHKTRDARGKRDGRGDRAYYLRTPYTNKNDWKVAEIYFGLSGYMRNPNDTLVTPFAFCI